ncbi:LytR/AlgR family response regulator transcription factor [Neolewinella agarilytica]|uniref:Two component transcriptional regulator, LytTR family n=1 Tax=Neolewinella agarilytica TaxID=478744 RepID=A0A1H9F2K8_9BACT|nr:response regulator [Neolewinella agarilytica]SEQ31683.1 two component transcriptional regulator, LytTR family [Neolewinella agarilytica]
MSFKILIVEDEELYADQLEMLVEKLGYEHLGTVDNSADALATIENTPPDLILMDVHINGEHDGIELAGLIQEKQLIPIIFITSLQDDLTFRRASRTGPLNFLVKPFNQLQLQRTIELTVRKLTENTPVASPTSSAPAAAAPAEPSEAPEKEPPSSKKSAWGSDFLFGEHFFIKNRQQLEKVAVADVLYLEADGHYCLVHTDKRKFIVHLPMSELGARLAGGFISCHRSYIVNVTKITSVDIQDNVVRLGDRQVPMSRRSKEAVLERLDWI